MSTDFKESVQRLAAADLNGFWIKDDLSLEKKPFIRWFCQPKAGLLRVALEKIENEIKNNDDLKNDKEFVQNYFKIHGKIHDKLIKGERKLRDQGIRDSVSKLAKKVTTTLSLESSFFQEKLGKEVSFVEKIEREISDKLNENQKKVLLHVKIKHGQGKLCGLTEPKYYHATKRKNMAGILDSGIEYRHEQKRPGAWVSTKPLINPGEEACYGDVAFALNDSIEQYDSRPDLDLENDLNTFTIGSNTYSVYLSRKARSFGLWAGFHSSIPVKPSKKLKREDRIAYYQNKAISFVIIPDDGSRELQEALIKRNIFFLTSSQFNELSSTLSKDPIVLPDSCDTSDRWTTEENRKNYGKTHPLSSIVNPRPLDERANFIFLSEKIMVLPTKK